MEKGTLLIFNRTKEVYKVLKINGDDLLCVSENGIVSHVNLDRVENGEFNIKPSCKKVYKAYFDKNKNVYRLYDPEKPQLTIAYFDADELEIMKRRVLHELSDLRNGEIAELVIEN